MVAVNPLFAQIAAAESFSKNPWLVAGMYKLEVSACFFKKGRKGNYVIAEFKVMESTATDPKFVPNAVGTSVSVVEDLSKDNAMGNIKAMLQGIVGCNKDELTPEVVQAALAENGAIDPDTKQPIVNPIVGTKVKLEAYMTTTKKGSPFTAKTWSHVPA